MEWPPLLAGVDEALRYFREGHARGKLAIDVTRSAPDGGGAKSQPAAVAV